MPDDRYDSRILASRGVAPEAGVPGARHPAAGAFSPHREAGWARESFALGAHLDGATATFAVYSKNAERVLLEIYGQPIGEAASFDYPMQKGPDDIWRARLHAVPVGTYYAFRCWGPNWTFSEAWRRGGSSAGFHADVDDDGHRFNPNKALFDPYARELSHDRETPEMQHRFGHEAEMYGSGPGPYRGLLGRLPAVVRREFDSGPWVPKAILIDDHTGFGQKPAIAPQDAAIYEAHVRGLTRHPSAARLGSILRSVPGFEAVENVPDPLRGTYAGAAYMAPYLKALGYTTIELLPVHEFANDINPEGSPGWDRELDEPPHGNHWGYMTYGFFAPDRQYAHDKSPGGPTREWKQMVRAFHDAGLQVFLDVVYNHTGEGGTWDSSLDSAELMFLRGLDNSEYYALTRDKRRYWESSGCGNNLDAGKPAARRLIVDSLAYWAFEMGVDGFRFDLAPVLGRTGPDLGFQRESEFLVAIAARAKQVGATIIAEAWDTRESLVGHFPAGWAEWNGLYRDAVRRFLKGDPVVFDFISAVNGGYEHFGDQGGAHKSIDFITAHDGFTLMDLCSYNQKNNGVAWPFGPSDGGNDSNDSWDSAGDRALRRTRMRSILTVQIFSRGVPMTLSGDEFGRTQNGNNNPYKIDSIGVWNNYEMIGTTAPTARPTEGTGSYHDNYGTDQNPTGHNGLFLFLKFLLEVRKAHGCLRQTGFADLELDAGDDVTYWFKQSDAHSDLGSGDRCVHWRIDGSAIGDTDFLLCVNMHYQTVRFAIPTPSRGRAWRRVIDTASWAEIHTNCWPVEIADTISSGYDVHPYSVLVLQES
jgi:isoamylase